MRLCAPLAYARHGMRKALWRRTAVTGAEIDLQTLTQFSNVTVLRYHANIAATWSRK